MLRVRCHERAGLSAGYSRLRGALFLECRRCGRPVAEIAVADVWAGRTGGRRMTLPARTKTSSIPLKARTLTECEDIIARGMATFVEVGQALLEIRDHRLYRKAGFGTFDLYCRKRWGWSRSYAHRHIQAAKVVGLLPIGDRTAGPVNEAQARALVPIANNSDTVMRILKTARARSQRMTAKHIHDAVQAEITQVAPMPALVETSPSTDDVRAPAEARLPTEDDGTSAVMLAIASPPAGLTIPPWTEAAAEARLDAAVQLEFTMWRCPDTDRSYLGVILGRLKQKYLRPLPIGHDGAREAPPRATKKGR